MNKSAIAFKMNLVVTHMSLSVLTLMISRDSGNPPKVNGE
jgi:hypothetical protein